MGAWIIKKLVYSMVCIVLRKGKESMIKPNIKIGIVYCDNSKRYAEQLKDVIEKYRKEGYPIEAIMVDEDLIDKERSIEAHVFNNLNECNYSMVFLTKDISVNGEKYKYVSKPNVLIELGYFRRHLEKNCTWCIIDFSYKEVEDNIYLKPSDILAETFEIIDPDNSYNSIKRVFKKFVEANNIVRLDNYDADDSIGSLILNSNYRTDYTELFCNSQLEVINKYSIKWQLSEIFNIWLQEKNKLYETEKIIYLFERMVFLPFFPEKIVGCKLHDFLYVDRKDDNGYINACYRILEYINDYEIYKREQQPDNYIIYREFANGIEHELEIFKDKKIAPIIECVARNYMGLAYLNAYLAIHKCKNDLGKECDILLKKSKQFFIRVIDLSRSGLRDKAEVFYAFAYYNLARTKRNLGDSTAGSDYTKAINNRDLLSKANYFPETVRLNFLLEKIHAEIDYLDYLKELGNSKNYEKKMKRLFKELKRIKKTPAADVSFFITLENKLEDRIKKIYS